MCCFKQRVTELRVGYPDDFFFISGLQSGSRLRSEFLRLVSASLLRSTLAGERANWKCWVLLSARFDWIPYSIKFRSMSEESSSVVTFLSGILVYSDPRQLELSPGAAFFEL